MFPNNSLIYYISYTAFCLFRKLSLIIKLFAGLEQLRARLQVFFLKYQLVGVFFICHQIVGLSTGLCDLDTATLEEGAT